MTDIVERLRFGHGMALNMEAADEIERLRANVARLETLSRGRGALGLHAVFLADAIGDEDVVQAKDDYVARIRAEALREAARSLPSTMPLPGGGVSLDYGGGYANWLRKRADEIETSIRSGSEEDRT